MVNSYGDKLRKAEVVLAFVLGTPAAQLPLPRLEAHGTGATERDERNVAAAMAKSSATVAAAAALAGAGGRCAFVLPTTQSSQTALRRTGTAQEKKSQR
eukprot:Skav211181  [mRNA]  locus=scaffold884:155328:158757:+ [translate_table: standard]